MRLNHGRHLTYCSNVHKGETWSEMLHGVLPAILRVKERMGLREMGVGLRLANSAAESLRSHPNHVQLFNFLREHGLYVFTVNGFPYGSFHDGKVKEAVYQPDWRDERRLHYSDTLASHLADLMPADVAFGSVSTVPLGFKRAFTSDDDYQRATQQLLAHVSHLAHVEIIWGKRVVIALEPEPHCVLETSQDCVRYFDRYLRSSTSLSDLARMADTTREGAAQLLRRHVGICLDTCHAAVEFEDPADLLGRLRSHEIPIYKVQLSAGLRARQANQAARAQLEAFAEDVYLHQVVSKNSDGLVRYLDLDEALSMDVSHDAEWRVHFHVPIFQDDYGELSSTQPFLKELLRLLPKTDSAHLEVETYTWSVLPSALRSDDITNDIISELRWARQHVGP